MTLFVDASAFVAILSGEPDGPDLLVRLHADADRVYAPVVLWESASALARILDIAPTQAMRRIEEFAGTLDIRMMSTGPDDARGAIEAWERYGKRSGHKAKLNMGDCLAYACAKTNGATLLYKGDDFRHTDLA